MAGKRSDSWFVLFFLAIFWPLKIFFVYYRNCIRDLARELASEWRGRTRYSGWER